MRHTDRLGKPVKTLGQVVAAEREKLHLTLKDLALLIRKESGSSVSAQYVHDIERDRRSPSAHTLGQLARALGFSVEYLASVGRMEIAEIADYLAEHPEAGRGVAALFRLARERNFDAWEALAGVLERVPQSPSRTRATAPPR